MHIDEPKTPYTPYEEGDNDYLEKVRRMFKVEATEDVLKDVSKELDKLKDKKNNEDEFMNVMIIDKDGNKNMKMVSKDHKENIEFLKKRKIAYENEDKSIKKESIFIEPSTGRLYNIMDSPYEKIDAIFNNYNFYINLHYDKPVNEIDWNLKKAANWEYVMLNSGEENDEEEKNSEEEEKEKNEEEINKLIRRMN